MTVAEETMKIKAREEFSSRIARAGLTRPELAQAAGISTRTLDSLSRPEGYNRAGTTRESTAWKIARGFAKLTSQEPEAAFKQLFVEVDESELRNETASEDAYKAMHKSSPDLEGGNSDV